MRLIKRYGSRKLYDSAESRYVSLDELAEWIRDGQEIRVVDKQTGEDVTSQTLTQVIVDAGKRDSSFPPSALLHELIRRGEKLVSDGVHTLGQGIDRLLHAGAEHVPPLKQVVEETRTLLRQRLDALEASLAHFEQRQPGPATQATGAAAAGWEQDVKENRS
jgi:polyhydroxyalkanoate synthesis repressor PhaR